MMSRADSKKEVGWQRMPFKQMQILFNPVASKGRQDKTEKKTQSSTLQIVGKDNNFKQKRALCIAW